MKNSNRDYCKKVLDMYETRCKRYEDLVKDAEYSEETIAEITAATLWHCLNIMINITEEE